MLPLLHFFRAEVVLLQLEVTVVETDDLLDVCLLFDREEAVYIDICN